MNAPLRRGLKRSSLRLTLVNLSRAAGGAIFFSIPLLMTMEMWQFGFTMSRIRLALFLVLLIPVLVRLNYQAGFEDVSRTPDYVRNAFSAITVGFITSTIILSLIGMLGPGEGISEMIGKISLQAAPASIGATLAASQLGEKKAGNYGRSLRQRYLGELFLMGVGSLFFAFNLAPTDEIPMIAYKVSVTRTVLLALFSILLVDAVVYKVEFRGHETEARGIPAWKVFLFYSTSGYAVALLVSFYILWTFGRFDGMAPPIAIKMVIVLAFPASLGAAAARLIM